METRDAYPLRDKLKVTTDDPIPIIWQQNEKLFWSEWIYKINIRKQLQLRRFVLTNQRLINFGDNKIGHKFLSFWSGTEIKREIPLSKIDQITVATKSNQFIIHISSEKEHDYNLAVKEERDEFISYIIKLRQDIPGLAPIKMRFLPQIDLFQFTSFEVKDRETPLPGLPIIINSLDW